MENKKEILSYRLSHKEDKLQYFKWSCDMIWILVKYKIWWGMDISFTVIKACDREEYFVRFFAE